MNIANEHNGDFIRETRKDWGFTQKEMAFCLGVTLRCVQHYEAETRPIPQTVVNLIAALNDVRRLHKKESPQ